MVTIFLESCDSTQIAKTDPFLSRDGEFLLYKGERLTGRIVHNMQDGLMLRVTPYRDGLPHGVEKDADENGQILAEREFLSGKKIGIHRGWFPNGNKRFLKQYLDGQFHGNQWEWRSEGSLYSLAKFDHGQVIGKRVWRQDGQIYMNFVLREGKAYGMTGGKLFNQVRRDENGRTIQF